MTRKAKPPEPELPASPNLTPRQACRLLVASPFDRWLDRVVNVEGEDVWLILKVQAGGRVDWSAGLESPLPLTRLEVVAVESQAPEPEAEP
jgi:hypothetical protein